MAEGTADGTLDHTPIAIIGMASLFPPARNLREFWENITHRFDGNDDAPSSFSPRFALSVAKEALDDAGYGDGRPFDRVRAGVVLEADATCAGSLAALPVAVSELAANRCDLVIAGGVDVDGSIPANSTGEGVRPHSSGADGMMPGEGIGIVVLKRLADAERDGDRIYAIIKESATSSDGHTRSAVGVAGLIRTALALHQKVLPPTVRASAPRARAPRPDSPRYLNTDTRPWIRAAAPRRARVSACSLDGTTYHAVLEEYESDHILPYRLHRVAQTIVLSAPTPAELLRTCREAAQELGAGAEASFTALASAHALAVPLTHARLGFVASSAPEARGLPERAIQRLEAHIPSGWHPAGWKHLDDIAFREQGTDLAGRLVALFSGEGARYPAMGRELALNFPPLRAAYSAMDSLFLADGSQPLSDVVFPLPDPGARKAAALLLRRADYALPAIGAFSVGRYRILQQAGFRPDAVAGHGFGELTALWAAGALADGDYLALARTAGQAMAAASESAGHTSLVAAAREPFARALATARFTRPTIPVYSNTTAGMYPDDPEAMRQRLATHGAGPLMFRQQIESIYAAGGRCFVEIGAGGTLSVLVRNILGDRPHLAVAVNPSRRQDSDRQLRRAVVQLRVAGLALGSVDPYALPREPERPRDRSATTIRLNGRKDIGATTLAPL